MKIIDIKPVAVGLNITANAVSFQVLTLDITPKQFKLNARFFYINAEPGLETERTEVSNTPFELPIEDYNNWQTDEYLESKCLTKLGLERA